MQKDHHGQTLRKNVKPSEKLLQSCNCKLVHLTSLYMIRIICTTSYSVSFEVERTGKLVYIYIYAKA